MSNNTSRKPTPVIPNKKAEGVIEFNRNLGSYRCVSATSGRCVLSGVSLKQATKKYPEFEVLKEKSNG